MARARKSDQSAALADASPPRASLMVCSGHIVVLRLFDVAYEIDIGRAEACWAARTQGSSSRGRLVAVPPKAISFGVPPLLVDIGSEPVAAGGAPYVGGASARLYDFGIAAVALRFPVSNLSWVEFWRLVNDLDAAIGPSVETPLWNTLLVRLRDLIGDAFVRPSAQPLQEDYLIATVEAFDQPLTADGILERVDLVPLLSGRDRPLSEGARRDLLRHRFSYYPDDLAVVTWDRAFLYEPQCETDVADVLQIANAQLLELRAYDDMLDSELPRMRELVEAARGRTRIYAARRYARLARRLQGVVAEVTELTERVDNALQVTEDVYLARVYAAAMDLFRVPAVTAAVNRKLAIIRETYTTLHSEAAGERTELLEIAILVLIATEIVLSFLRH